jgi:alkanesulfonate monooxygenase SsuD/methylene tetrahydromethanopterin reductase-like flavin-dependent oxidoreductase (luciferase family)
MGLWPGEAHFAKRYDYSTEYVTVLRELWEKGSSDFKGEYFQMTDCKLSPRPQADMKLVCAGQSPRGMEFGATYCDYNFTLGKGVNTPTAHSPTNLAMRAAAAKTGRDVGNYVLMMVIADETDEAAMAKWWHYNEGADMGALAYEESDDPSAKRNNGALGWFAKKDMDPAFADAAFALKNPGDVSEPVQSEFGWHVIRLDGRRPPSVKPYDEVREVIMSELKKRQVDEKRDEAVNAIRRDPATQVNREAVSALTPRIDVDAAVRAVESPAAGPTPPVSK